MTTYYHPDALTELPLPEEAQVILDFDGTITRRDVLDDLVLRYSVDDSWKRLEKQWQAGLIGSHECLSREFDLLRIGREELDRFLDRVEMDPGTRELFQTLSSHQVPAMILSDGIERFIRRLLARCGIHEMTVRANAVEHTGDRLRLICPNSSKLCEMTAAHCKCASARELKWPGRRLVYVGDGRSDLCPAHKADVVFAKGVLARELTRRAIPYLPFETLKDVNNALTRAWRRSRVRERSGAGWRDE